MEQYLVFISSIWGTMLLQILKNSGMLELKSWIYSSSGKKLKETMFEITVTLVHDLTINADRHEN